MLQDVATSAHTKENMSECSPSVGRGLNGKSIIYYAMTCHNEIYHTII